MRAPNKLWPVHAIFALFFLYLAFCGGLCFYWMRTQTPLPLWGELIFLLPGLFIPVFLSIVWRSFVKGNPSTPRVFAVPLGIIALVFALFASQHSSKFLVLVSLYGYSTVQIGHFHFISTEKTEPWVVSNGDHVKEAEDLRSLVNGDIFLLTFFVLYLPVYLLLPKRKSNRSTQISFTIFKRKRTFSRG